ncbi:MAG: DUF444 family protein [Planctomycetes bacterium]|nr:DUF444 family protein [Planctomycetota bacterium]
MIRKIQQDHARFKQIVRGRIRKNLRHYITRGEIIGKKDGKLVSIPLPQIDVPRFRFGARQQGGVGQGDGDPGTPLGGDPQGQGGGQAGDQPGEHILEVDISLDDLAQILGEELELPKIEPRGHKSLKTTRDRYTGVRRVGPESLRVFKRTFKQALKRQIAEGRYDPERPLVYPFREDRRYRSRKVAEEPESNAVIVYMMDVSGSMGFEQKEIVRIESFWIDTWLRSQYKAIDSVYIVHDVAAKEVDRHTFFHIRESGGTKISSAYALCDRVIDSRFNPSDWNIYLFHFSDGDNWGGDDTKRCMSLLREQLIPKANLFCYGQVKSAYGSGQFVKDLQEHLAGEEKVILSEIDGKDEIYDSIKAFLGKGK